MAGTMTADQDSTPPVVEHKPFVPAAAPVTEDAFVADRMAFWSWFTGTIARAVIGLAVLLILLWFFLVR
jgi:hypothetical protein